MSPHELEWIGAHGPAEAAMVRITDDWLTTHETWDSLHEFVLLASDGSRLFPVMAVAITTDVHPDHYQSKLAGAVGDFMRSRLRATPAADPVVAALLQVETFGFTSAGPVFTPAQQAAVRNRTVGDLAGRYEQVMVHSCDVAGRAWTATKRRNLSGPDVIGAATSQEIRFEGNFPAMVRALVSVIPGMYTAAAQSFWTPKSERG